MEFIEQSARLIHKTIPTIDIEDNIGLVAYIARVSSKLAKGKRSNNSTHLLDYLIEHNHWSPFEHVYYGFELTTSLAIGTQLLRHRSFTFQQVSKRYNNESPKYIKPELRLQAETNRQSSTTPTKDDTLNNTVIAAIEAQGRLYNELIGKGIASECARAILPQCTATEIIMTGNIRSWYHFMLLRKDVHAQLEMQQLATLINNILEDEINLLFRSVNTEKK